MKKTDIRLQFTRRVLRESLVTLMKTKSILNIAVKDICEAADVGRSAFYAHYQSQYDLLKEIEDHAFSSTVQVMDRHLEEKLEPSAKDLRAGFKELLEHIQSSRDSIQALLSENGDPRFQRQFFMAAIERMRFIRKRAGDKTPDEKKLKYTSLFAIGGFIALIQEWLKSGIDTPIPAMAALFAKLSKEGFVNAINDGKKRRGEARATLIKSDETADYTDKKDDTDE
jgi:AcrR family transcriptional regulator